MKVISAIVGLVLLGASFILASLASNNANEMIAKQDVIVMQYIKQSNNAMETEDYKNATKFIKLAIQADPKSKKAFKAYEEIMKAKYKPAQTETSTMQEQPSTTPMAEEEEEDDDMGC